MKTKGRIFLLTVVFVLFMGINVYGDSIDKVAYDAIDLGWWTVLPPVVAIVLAFITKNVVLSLFIGIFCGAFLLNLQGNHILAVFVQAFLSIIVYVLNSLADPWNAGIILQVLTIGGLIALITRMGGARAVAESLAQKAKGPRSAQLITWILGLFVFFDDYANSLIVGPIMRPVTDKMKISRERLAFIVDSTAAPVAGIALISTWVGYEIGLIKDGYASIGQTVNSYGVFIDTIPYRFYNLLMLLFVALTSATLREFGPMLQAERRARKYNKLLRDGAKPMVTDEEVNMQPKEGIKLNIWNAIIPIVSLIIFAFIGFYFDGYSTIMAGQDSSLIALMKNYPASFEAIREAFGASDASVVLFQAALLSSGIAMIMGTSQKIFTLSEAIDTWIEGMKSLVITGVILLLAWSLSSVIKELGTAQFIVSLLTGAVPTYLLPSIIFILGAIISFATGTSYGTMGILMPLAIPLAHALSQDPNFIVMATGAVLTGAIFGDHCSPISDTTILSSMGAAADHLDHVRTQLWYSLTIALITVVFGYLPVGLGMPIGIVLPMAMAVVVLIVYFIGQPIEKESADSN